MKTINSVKMRRKIHLKSQVFQVRFIQKGLYIINSETNKKIECDDGEKEEEENEHEVGDCWKRNLPIVKED